MARRSGHSFAYADRVHLALGWGAGHAACHALFFCAALLPLAAGDGSLYSEACPHMSVFLAAALQSLGTSATLLAAAVVGMEGWRRRSALHIAYAPAVHVASALLVGCLLLLLFVVVDVVCLLVSRRFSLLLTVTLPPTPNPQSTSTTSTTTIIISQTLGSFAPGGCAVSVPAVVVLGAANAAYAARYVWANAPAQQQQEEEGMPLSPMGAPTSARRAARREVRTVVVPVSGGAGATGAAVGGGGGTG